MAKYTPTNANFWQKLINKSCLMMPRFKLKLIIHAPYDDAFNPTWTARALCWVRGTLNVGCINGQPCISHTYLVRKHSNGMERGAVTQWFAQLFLSFQRFGSHILFNSNWNEFSLNFRLRSGRVATVFEHELNCQLHTVFVIREIAGFDRVSRYPRALRQLEFLLSSPRLTSSGFRLLSHIVGRLLTFEQSRPQYEKSKSCRSNTEESEGVQIPLLPKRAGPKLLFSLAVLTVGGFWLSDYGFTTTKHSEQIALILWAIGTFGGAFCCAALAIYATNAFYTVP